MTQSNLQYHGLTEQPEDRTAQPPADELAIKLDVLDNQSRIVSSTVQMVPRVEAEKLPLPNLKSKHLSCLEKGEGKLLKATEFDKEVSVITPEQRQMLDQQMRMYTQLLTQNFLQLHGHPELWRQGPAQKEYLVIIHFYYVLWYILNVVTSQL